MLSAHRVVVANIMQKEVGRMYFEVCATGMRQVVLEGRGREQQD